MSKIICCFYLVYHYCLIIVSIFSDRNEVASVSTAAAPPRPFLPHLSPPRYTPPPPRPPPPEEPPCYDCNYITAIEDYSQPTAVPRSHYRAQSSYFFSRVSLPKY